LAKCGLHIPEFEQILVHVADPAFAGGESLDDRLDINYLEAVARIDRYGRGLRSGVGGEHAEGERDGGETSLS